MVCCELSLHPQNGLRLSDVTLSHAQTLACAKLAEADFIKLIKAFIKSHFSL